MKNIILPSASDTNIYLSDINSETAGIIIVYSKENAIGYITCDDDDFWNFSQNVSSYPDINDDILNRLADTIMKKYEDVTFKLLEFN